jgi:hypothetical protein
MLASVTPQALVSLPAGTVIRVSHGWYDHVALIGDRFILGERSVLSFSAQIGGLIEQPFSVFALGRVVKVEGYPGELTSQMVMRRARMKQEQAYSLVSFNCEHFVRHAHGLLVESPQMWQWTLIACVLGLSLTKARV